jgi:hypothetical protein
LEEELSQLKEECNRLLEERTIVKQENNNYRVLVKMLEN